MKLNATTEMIPITWRDFSAMHPFAPLDQAQGYQQLFEELEEMLCEVHRDSTRFRCSPTPARKGEYAGLIRDPQVSRQPRRRASRNICLIPLSPPMAPIRPAPIMAGLKVVVVGCDDEGNVDVADL